MSMPIFKNLGIHFPDHSVYLTNPRPFATMLLVDPTGRIIVELFERVLEIENWNEDCILHYLAIRTYKSLSEAKALGREERKDFNRLTQVFERVVYYFDFANDEQVQEERERVRAFMASRQPSTYGYSFKKKAEPIDGNRIESNVLITEEKENDKISPEVKKIIDDILTHTERNSDDRIFQENRQKLTTLIDYYHKDKLDVHEPRAREMLKDMFSIPKKQYPTDEEFAKIKKLKSKMGRLIHPDKFSSATLELKTTIQEIFQFLDSCLCNSGYTRR